MTKEAVVDTAHQYKIRVEQSKKKHGGLFGEYGTGIDLSLNNSLVKPISRNEAKKIILKYEWLGSMSNTTHHYGIFFENVIGGVVCYGLNCTANFNCSTEFGVPNDSLWFLARGACVHWTPKGAASRLIAQSLKLLKKQVPKARVALAYSDTDAGEIGTVYQATNWLYIGRGSHKTVNWFNPKTGRKFDERILHNLKFKYNLTRTQVRHKLMAEGWKILPKTVKHKYCFLLGNRKENKAVLKKIKPLPYPKRNN